MPTSISAKARDAEILIYERGQKRGNYWSANIKLLRQQPRNYNLPNVGLLDIKLIVPDKNTYQ